MIFVTHYPGQSFRSNVPDKPCLMALSPLSPRRPPLQTPPRTRRQLRKSLDLTGDDNRILLPARVKKYLFVPLSSTSLSNTSPLLAVSPLCQWTRNNLTTEVLINTWAHRL